MLNLLPVRAHTLLILFFTDFGIFSLSFQIDSDFFELPSVLFEIAAKFLWRPVKWAYYRWSGPNQFLLGGDVPASSSERLQMASTSATRMNGLLITFPPSAIVFILIKVKGEAYNFAYR